MLCKSDELYYFNLFFKNIPFYRLLKKQNTIKDGQFGFDLVHPHCKPIWIEMNKWFEMAYKYNYAECYKRRLNRIRKKNIILQSMLNELMVAYFLHNRLHMQFRYYKPPAVRGRFGEWLFCKEKQDIFVEVKSPWEKRVKGSRFIGQKSKLMKDIKKAYKQRPTSKMPFIIFITDDLQLHLSQYNEELLDVLYGDRALCFTAPNKNGAIEYLGYNVINKRVIFQKNLHRGLSSIGILSLTFDLNLKLEIIDIDYAFTIYHNRLCYQECQPDFNWFKPYKQYLSHYEIIE